VNHDQVTNEADVKALVLGLGMFATGGGGLAERGMGYLRDLLADDVQVKWTSIDRLPSDTLTCSVYGMGSIAPHPPMTQEEMRAFGVDGVQVARPWVRAVDELELYLGQRIEAVIPFELGPSNTVVAIDAAARSGRLLVDGDYIGRALPKMSQALPAILGLETWPLVICDPWGNALIMKDCPSPAVAERVGKMVSRVTKAVDTAASCSHAAFPLTIDRVRPAVVVGTLSRSLEVGRRVMAARADGVDPVAAAADATGGRVLFRGTVADRRWEDSADGYMEGTTVIAGTGTFASSTAEIWFQNEHHILWQDGTLRASSPDIIAVVDGDTAEPWSNAQIESGFKVAVLGIDAADPYTRGPALAATAPRHYGYDIDWSSFWLLAEDEG
jgi:uncharacterized protein